MSLTDTVNLVYQALMNGKNGDIFVQKSPSATIETVVKSLLKIFKKIMLKNIGVRHGERLYEILISKEEMLRTVNKNKYFVIKPDNKNRTLKIFLPKVRKILTI